MWGVWLLPLGKAAEHQALHTGRRRGVRSWLYRVARWFGDVNAVKRGKVGQRVVNKVIGRQVGRLWRR